MVCDVYGSELIIVYDEFMVGIGVFLLIVGILGFDQFGFDDGVYLLYLMGDMFVFEKYFDEYQFEMVIIVGVGYVGFEMVEVFIV